MSVRPRKAPDRRGQRFTNRSRAKIVYFCRVIHLLRSRWTAFAGSALDLGSLRHNGLYGVGFLHPITTTIDRNQSARTNAAGDLNALPVALPSMTLVKWMRSCSTIGTSELPDQAAPQSIRLFFRSRYS